MPVREFLGLLGEEILDPDEETFLLFAQKIPSSDLGFVDSAAESLHVEVGGREFEILQSPGVLGSRRAGGTTGAVLWNVTPRLATWLSPPTSPLSAILTPESNVLELGCGTSALLALVTAPKVGRYVLTDQPYVLKTLTANLLANEEPTPTRAGKGKRRGKQPPKPARRAEAQEETFGPGGNISFSALDWERDVPGSSLAGGPGSSFDVVLAADCVYNEALVRPFVQTCADACALRGTSEDAEEREDGKGPAMCIVAQQLREPDVFACWLEAFHEKFRTWRVPDGVVGEGLGAGSGFVVHVGVLR